MKYKESDKIKPASSTVSKAWPLIYQTLVTTRAASSTVEHLPLKEVVGGSNPPRLTRGL